MTSERENLCRDVQSAKIQEFSCGAGELKHYAAASRPTLRRNPCGYLTAGSVMIRSPLEPSRVARTPIGTVAL